MSPRTETCQLCGIADLSVKTTLILWRNGKDRFGAGPRCADHDRCWSRVQDSGQPWEVDDARPERRAG